MDFSAEQLLSSIINFTANHKLGVSLVFVLLILVLKRLVVRLIRSTSKRKGEDRRHQINLIKQLINAIMVVALFIYWASEVQNFAISIAAFMVAIVFATREYLQCFLGFLFYMSTRPFRVGDWIEINNQHGEVVEIDWATTTLLEIDRDDLIHTGKHVHIPNNQLILHSLKNLNFLRRYRLYKFTIVNEPDVNAYELLPEMQRLANLHCEPFRDVAARYSMLIERSLEQHFISVDPVLILKTNELAKLELTVSIFCPTNMVDEIERKISADWMALWFAARDRKQNDNQRIASTHTA